MVSRSHQHVPHRFFRSPEITLDAQDLVDTGLMYISYAQDAYAPAMGSFELRRADTNVDGSSSGEVHVNVGEWLKANDYSPIVDPLVSTDPITKYYGICKLEDDVIIVGFRGTVAYGGDRTRFWWNPTTWNVDEISQYLCSAFQVDAESLKLHVLPGFTQRVYSGSTCNVGSLYLSILQRVDASLQAFIAATTPNAKKIVFCGHSLGGALAQLAAMEYLRLNPENVLPVELVTYAAPLVGDQAYINALTSMLPNATHILNANDPVPQLWAQGLAAEWNGWECFGQFIPYGVVPSSVKYISLVAPTVGVLTLNNGTSSTVFGTHPNAHPLNLYYDGLKGYGINPSSAWSWGKPVAISNSTYDRVNADGDWATATIAEDGIDYLFVVFPQDGALTICIFNGSTWSIYNPTNGPGISDTQGVQLAAYNGSILLSWVDSSNNIWLAPLGTDGVLDMTQKIDVTGATGETSDRPPSMYCANGRLYMVYREDTTGTRPLWTLSMINEVSVVNGISSVVQRYSKAALCDAADGSESQDTPTTCSVQGSGGYMVYRGASTGTIFWGVNPLVTAGGKGWTQNESNFSSKQPVGAAILNTDTKTYAIVGYKSGGTGSSSLYFWYQDLSGAGAAPVQVSISNHSSGTNNAISLVNYKNQILMFYSDNKNHNAISYSTLS